MGANARKCVDASEKALSIVDPLIGHLKVRLDDGSCVNTATCPYLSVADGGTGTIRGQMDPCDLCVGSACDAFSCTKKRLLWVG